MRSLIQRSLKWGALAFVLVFLTALGPEGLPSSHSCEEGVDLQIITDHTSYAPGAVMHVKLLVTNTGKTPLYFFRGVSQCSSQYGSLSLHILDRHNNITGGVNCSVDTFSMDTLDVVQTLNNQKTGVLLEDGQIYGQDQSYDLPKKKGTYRLRAQFSPFAVLTDEQARALAQSHMRVLRSNCVASVVAITVK